MSICEESNNFSTSGPLSDSSFEKTMKRGLGDDFDIEVTGVPNGVPFGYKKGTNIVRKKYFVSLAMGESPLTDAMVKERSIFCEWANHPMFNVGDGSVKIDGKYLFPKKILIDYDRNSVTMDFEMFEIVENGVHSGYVAKPDNAMMNFEYAYEQDGYKIRKIEV